MNRLIECQIVVMIKDTFPESVDYEKLVENLFEKLNQKMSSSINIAIDAPLLNDRECVIGSNENMTVGISGKNFRLTIRSFDNDWQKQIYDIVNAMDSFVFFIGERFDCEYRLGVILTFEISSSKAKAYSSKALRDEKAELPAWNVSFLEIITNNGTKINKWERIDYNKNAEASTCVIDVNSSLENGHRFRANRLKNVYDDMKELLYGTYDEFSDAN